jgi:hypothetical protein
MSLFYTHTGVNDVLSDSINTPSILSRSDSNAMRVALHCAVWMPRKNNSTVAQYVIDSLSVSVYGSGSYISFTSYTLTLYRIVRVRTVLSTSLLNVYNYTGSNFDIVFKL